MKLWDKGYDIDGFTELFTIGKDRELDVMLAGGRCHREFGSFENVTYRGLGERGGI